MADLEEKLNQASEQRVDYTQLREEANGNKIDISSVDIEGEQVTSGVISRVSLKTDNIKSLTYSANMAFAKRLSTTDFTTNPLTITVDSYRGGVFGVSGFAIYTLGSYQIYYIPLPDKDGSGNPLFKFSATTGGNIEIEHYGPAIYTYIDSIGPAPTSVQYCVWLNANEGY